MEAYSIVVQICNSNLTESQISGFSTAPKGPQFVDLGPNRDPNELLGPNFSRSLISLFHALEPFGHYFTQNGSPF